MHAKIVAFIAARVIWPKEGSRNSDPLFLVLQAFFSFDVLLCFLPAVGATGATASWYWYPSYGDDWGDCWASCAGSCDGFAIANSLGMGTLWGEATGVMSWCTLGFGGSCGLEEEGLWSDCFLWNLCVAKQQSNLWKRSKNNWQPDFFAMMRWTWINWNTWNYVLC